MNKSLSIREVVHNINEKYGNNTVFSAKDLVKTSKETKKTNIFKSFYSINVNEYMEKKNGLSYISWTYAWAEAKKKFPNITYKVHRFGEKQLPYVFDENTGYMVSTEMLRCSFFKNFTMEFAENVIPTFSMMKRTTRSKSSLLRILWRFEISLVMTAA